MDEDINWVRTNLRTAKNHSAQRGDMPCRSCTVILWLAAQKLCGIAEFLWNSSDFVKFLGTCIVYIGFL